MAADGANVRASGHTPHATIETGNRPQNVFSGQYGWTSADHQDRWLTGVGASNSWIVIDLGAEYEINDVVLRWHSHNAFPALGFRIDVRGGNISPEVWGALNADSEYWEDWLDWLGTWGDAPEPGYTDTENGWRTAWSLLERVSPPDAGRFTALFRGYGNSSIDNLQTGGNGGLGPWTAQGRNMGTLVESPQPLRGRFIKLHTGGTPINTGVGLSLWNFEIYGTPVAP